MSIYNLSLVLFYSKCLLLPPPLLQSIFKPLRFQLIISENISNKYTEEKSILNSLLGEDTTNFSDEDSDDFDTEESESLLAADISSIPEIIVSNSKLEIFGTITMVTLPYIIITPQTPTTILDIGSLVIHSDSSIVIGKVWDIIGQVSNPLYSVICRSAINAPQKGDIVRFSPEHIQLVSKENLLKDHGIDADPNSGPVFSDDESERAYKKGIECGELFD